MARITPIAYNTGTTIYGTEQIGNLSVGLKSQEYNKLGPANGLKYYPTPDQDSGYVIAHPDLVGRLDKDNQTANLGFWRTSNLTESGFVQFTNNLFNQSFSDGSSAKTYLNSNGYWTNFVPNLIVNLDAGNSLSYPGTGTIWNDLSGNGYDAVLYNGTSYSSNNGGVMVFDGLNDYIESNINLPSLSEYSVELYLYVDLTGYPSSVPNGGWNVFLDVNGAIRVQTGGETPNPKIQTHAGNGYAWIYTELRTTSTLKTNTWYHFVVTFKSGVRAQHYLNGVLESSQGVSASSVPSNKIDIGRWTGGAGYLNGRIGFVKIYDRELTSNEVLQNYTSTNFRFNIPSSTELLVNYDLSNSYSYSGSGSTLYDLSGNGLNATLYNSPSFSSNDGGYLNFNGTNNYAVINTSWPRNFTVNFWLKFPSLYGGRLLHTGPNFLFELGDFSGLAYFIESASWSWLPGRSGVVPIPYGQWVNFTAVMDNDASSFKIYKNGTLSLTGSSQVVSGDQTIYIGARTGPDEFGNFLLGSMMIIKRAITETEITQYYNATKSRFGL